MDAATGSSSTGGSGGVRPGGAGGSGGQAMTGNGGGGGSGSGGAGRGGSGGSGNGGSGGGANNGGSGGASSQDAARVEAGAQDGPRAGGDGASVRVPAVIDAHIHLWDLMRNLDFSNMKNALAPEFATKARAAGITGAVLIESVWKQAKGDNMWGIEQAEKNDVIVAVMGNLSFGSATFKDDVTALAKSKYFRGLRAGMSDLAHANMSVIADLGLAIDVNPSGAAAVMSVANAAKARSGVNVIIDHGAGITYTGSPDAAWMTALDAMAKVPNVYMKISRFQEQAGGGAAPTNADAYRKILDMFFAALGEDRLIFGTNWPLSEAKGTLADAVKIMKDWVASKSPAVQAKFFAGNAKKAYAYVDR
jgi:L-fuconolactonase